MLVRHHPEFSELPPHLIELSVWRKTSMAPISPCVRTYTLQGYPSLCIINSQFQQKVSLHGNFHSVITGLMNFFSHFSDQFNYSYQLMECFNFEWTYCCRLHLFLTQYKCTNAHPCQITRLSQYQPIKCYSKFTKQIDGQATFSVSQVFKLAWPLVMELA